jgi:hypothetical protein
MDSKIMIFNSQSDVLEEDVNAAVDFCVGVFSDWKQLKKADAEYGDQLSSHLLELLRVQGNAVYWRVRSRLTEIASKSTNQIFQLTYDPYFTVLELRARAEKQHLPDPYSSEANGFLAKGGSLLEFFEDHPELGKPTDWDLSEFSGGE